MDNLIKIFKYSSDNVIITDYDFNILWSNRESDIFSVCNGNCSVYFKEMSLPLKSSEYYINFGSLLYECKVINYPEYESGIYVIQINDEDVLYSAVKSRGVKETLINQSGALRNAVAGINSSVVMLRRKLDEAEMYDEQKYLDITDGNCRKLLNTSAGIIELIHYADKEIEMSALNLSRIMDKFILKSSNILRNKIIFEQEIEDDLYVESDVNRLEFFLAALVVLARGDNKENNIIKITAERTEDCVSITVRSDSNGSDYDKTSFTQHVDMYKGSEFKVNLFVVERFCKVFGGRLLISADNETHALNVRLPLLKDVPTEAKQIINEYDEGVFSKYHIIYSDILH